MTSGMETVQEKKCPHCGALNNPEAVFCNSCQKGITFMGRMAQPWGKKGLSSRLSCTWAALTGAGCLTLFLFPPLGAFLLFMSVMAQFMLNKTTGGPCPYCKRLAPVRKAALHGSEVQCIHCEETLYVDRTSGKLEYSTESVNAADPEVKTAPAARPPSLNGSQQVTARSPFRWVKVAIPVVVVLIFGSSYVFKRLTISRTMEQGQVQRVSSPSDLEAGKAAQGTETKSGGDPGAGKAALPETAASAGGERILSFHSEITVNRDASLMVRETIRVRAEGKEIKRGIYRDFPTRYRDRLGNRVTVGFTVLEVLREGRKEPFHTKSTSQGTRVYLGKSDVFIEHGIHTYTLSYSTDRQIGFFEDFDELYWNVTGNEWAFPIDKAGAEILLPEGAGVLESSAYTGRKGAQGKDYTVSGEGVGSVVFTATRILQPGEGLTVAVSWPKGIVAAPDAGQKVRNLLTDNPNFMIALGGLLLVLLYYAVAWLKVGRDPSAGVIAPHYSPPEGYSPAAVRYVLRMGYSDRAFAAAVVNMAVKGFLTIEDDGGTYTLHRADADESVLTGGEKKIARKLFGSSRSILLKRTNHSRIGGAVKALKKSLQVDFEKMNFSRNAGWLVPGALLTGLCLLGIVLTAGDREMAIFMTLWLGMWTLATLGLSLKLFTRWRAALGGEGQARMAGAFAATLFALPFLIGEIFGIVMFTKATSPAVTAFFLLIVSSNLVFARLLKAPTVQGRGVMDRIEGFKMFLEAAEKDRLERMNPPEKTPALFEKFLPFAIALGVENSWSEKFAGVLSAAGEEGQNYRPVWYSGRQVHSFSPSLMAASLGPSLASVVSSSSTAPGSSSGSGGGGSSGGGGGGGGGGGW